MAVIVRSKLSTSITNKMPATGALKIDEKVPAVAAAISRLRCLMFKCSSRARLDPMAPPVRAEGPSKPAEPPKPTVTGAVMSDAKV